MNTPTAIKNARRAAAINASFALSVSPELSAEIANDYARELAKIEERARKIERAHLMRCARVTLVSVSIIIISIIAGVIVR